MLSAPSITRVAENFQMHQSKLGSVTRNSANQRRGQLTSSGGACSFARQLPWLGEQFCIKLIILNKSIELMFY